LFGAIIVMLPFFRPDIVFPTTCLLLYPLILFTGRRVLLPQLRSEPSRLTRRR